jgi:hypothetical protein
MQKLVDFTKFKVLEVEKLCKAEWNYKHENDFLTEKLQANFERNGQMENILVRELEDGTYEVVNGNHRYDVLQKLGVSQVVAYDLGKISKEEAMRIAIETNETKFQVDQIKLGEVIAEVAKEFTQDDLVTSLPFSPQEIENFVNIQEFDWDDYDSSGRVKGGSTDVVEQARQTLKVTLSESGMRVWHNFINKCLEISESLTEGEILEVALRLAYKHSLDDIEEVLEIEPEIEDSDYPDQ